MGTGGHPPETVAGRGFEWRCALFKRPLGVSLTRCFAERVVPGATDRERSLRDRVDGLHLEPCYWLHEDQPRVQALLRP